MNRQQWIQAIKYYVQFFPFKLNIFLVGFIVLCAYNLLLNINIESSSFYGIASLMAKIGLVFGLSVILISFLSALICFIYFKYVSKKTLIEIKTALTQGANKKLLIELKLPKVLKPFLGFVKMRLIYNKHSYTENLLIAGRIKGKSMAIANGLQSTNELFLPDIQEYHFPKAILYFEDMLQLFSLAGAIKVSQYVINLPHSLVKPMDELSPKKTEEELVKIEQLRKVEGEPLNYKKFEDSDDVRRIVWKIFAKNKELVVRVPEVINPYASHIYFYATFFNQNLSSLNTKFHHVMLNHYKDCIWTLFDTLTKQTFVVKYISDQLIHINDSTLDPTQATIALSKWQNENTPAEYFKAKHGSVLCIHSFTPLQEVTQLCEQCDASTTIFFIQLGHAFKSQYILNWVSKILFKSSDDELKGLKSRWAWHPLKFKTLALEKKIKQTLEKFDLKVEYL